MTDQFDNHSSEQLADLLGQIDIEAKALEAKMSAIKAELLERGVEHAEGEMFAATKSAYVRWSLDKASVEEEMGEPWVFAHSKPANVVSWRLTINRAALAA